MHANFNSRPCERGFDIIYLLRIVYIISIHAPAKGASGMQMFRITPVDISIHAPAKGASGIPLCGLPFFHISIHAPAKGASLQCGCPPNRLSISIHAPAKGASTPYEVEKVVKKFQFTPLRKGLPRPMPP